MWPGSLPLPGRKGCRTRLKAMTRRNSLTRKQPHDHLCSGTRYHQYYTPGRNGHTLEAPSENEVCSLSPSGCRLNFHLLCYSSTLYVYDRSPPTMFIQVKRYRHETLRASQRCQSCEPVVFIFVITRFRHSMSKKNSCYNNYCIPRLCQPICLAQGKLAEQPIDTYQLSAVFPKPSLPTGSWYPYSFDNTDLPLGPIPDRLQSTARELGPGAWDTLLRCAS